MRVTELAKRIPALPPELFAPRNASRIFISGHSLVDQPLPNYVAAIGRSLGHSIEWNRQYIVGSAIARRTHGPDRSASEWSGYRDGDNRDGAGLDVLGELRDPKTIEGGRYDVLLITEQHGLLGTLIWNDTVKYLRHYHDRMIEANPAATTYFYESWISLDDKNDPRRWIEYERKMSPLWQCIATRVNLALEAEGRRDRIVSLPAGLALAALIEQATSGAGLPGLTASTRRTTIDSLIQDAVHLTDLGSYYMALVTFASIHHHRPVSAWAPEGVAEQTSTTLQAFAWDFVRNYYASYSPISLAECRKRLDAGLIEHYWAYMRDAYWKADEGLIRAQLRYMRQTLEWRYRLSRHDGRNPFHFDP